MAWAGRDARRRRVDRERRRRRVRVDRCCDQQRRATPQRRVRGHLSRRLPTGRRRAPPRWVLRHAARVPAHEGRGSVRIVSSAWSRITAWSDSGIPRSIPITRIGVSAPRFLTKSKRSARDVHPRRSRWGRGFVPKSLEGRVWVGIDIDVVGVVVDETRACERSFARLLHSALMRRLGVI